MRLPAEALLFDMDGLMIDSEPVWMEVEGAIARSLGHEWTEELARGCIGTGLPATIRTINEGLGAAIPIDEGVERLIEGFLARVPALKLKPGCRALVEAAHGRMPLAVASSSPLRLIVPVLERFGLRERFDAVVSGESVARPKPAPDIFLRAAELVGRAPAGCVVLEDSVAGVTAGRAAGMQVIAVPEGEPERFANLTELVVADLHEARALLGLA